MSELSEIAAAISILKTAVSNRSKIQKWLDSHCPIEIKWRRKNVRQAPPTPHPILLEQNDHLWEKIDLPEFR